MEPTPVEKLLIDQLNRLEEKVDKVRTEDIPSAKIELAKLVTENKANSKLHSFIGSIAAVIISSIMPHR